MSPMIVAPRPPHPCVVILIPCYNEAQTIAKVVADFRQALPAAEIFVFDNGSTDRTAAEARAAGATVVAEPRRGKGYVVRAMFEKVQADAYVLVDGDDTYPAERVPSLVEPILNDEADMVVGSRTTSASQSQFRALNLLGNQLYQQVINTIFGTRLTDILSGYRCFSPRLVQGVPIAVTGFEVEAELTIKALERGYRILEVPVDLRPRPEGSHSKIRLARDGFKILWTILSLFRDYKPLTFFGALGLGFIGLGLIPGLVAVLEFFKTGLVLHFPSAILAVGLVLTGMLLLVVGLILHTVNRRFQELGYYLRRLVERRP